MKLLFYLLISVLFINCGGDRNFSNVKNISEVKDSDFIPTLEQEINKNKNQIYCSTVLYAWNEVKNEFKDKVEINKEFEQLRLVHKSNLFINSLATNEIQNSISIDDESIRARSEFSKSLPFALIFERNNHKLFFDSKPVESFGFNGYDPELSSQVEILFYKNDNEFAIRLKPKDKAHEILVFTSSKVKGISLGEMLETLNNKVKQHSNSKKSEKDYWKYSFGDSDILSIPIINFNIEKDYETIKGNTVKLNGSDYTIIEAYQRIALILDQEGAKVESEAEISTVTEAVEEEPKAKRLIFNKPFLLVFKRKDSVNPYLVAWINNAELMVKK